MLQDIDPNNTVNIGGARCLFDCNRKVLHPNFSADHAATVVIRWVVQINAVNDLGHLQYILLTQIACQLMPIVNSILITGYTFPKLEGNHDPSCVPVLVGRKYYHDQPMHECTLATLQHLAYLLVIYKKGINMLHPLYKRKSNPASLVDLQTNLDGFSQ